jgi:transposase InsO family protein
VRRVEGDESRRKDPLSSEEREEIKALRKEVAQLRRANEILKSARAISMRQRNAGSQYTSIDYTQTLDDHNVLSSIGTVGDAYDNAVAESFVDSFKTELITDRTWATRSQLELAVVEYVAWFNNERLHEALGDQPPREREEQCAEQQAAITSRP